MGEIEMIYTQEPWEIQNGSTGPYIIAKDGNGKHVTVAQFFSRGLAGCETKGNVNLGKVAPKMYEALKEFQDTQSCSFGLIDKILAEVEGKGEEDGMSI